jgi:hypothetical protein
MTDAATHIRYLFREPKESYSVRDAAEILCMPPTGPQNQKAQAAVSGFRFLVSGFPVPASFAMGFWSQEAIEEALGADIADAIPELLRLADLEVRIPRLEILALERLADGDGKSVDAVLARELLDVVSAHSEYLATAIPGFTAALRWPQ